MQISHTLTELTFCVVYLLIIVKFVRVRICTCRRVLGIDRGLL